MKEFHKRPSAIQVWKNDSKRKYIHSYSSKIVGDNLGAYYVEGGSASVDDSIAKNKAVFEAIERYSGSKIPISLKKGSYEEIQNKAVNPNAFIFFAENQYKKSGFPYRKYSPRDQIEWVEGSSLIDSKKIFIPAFAVYLGYNQRISNSEKYFPTASCGLAIHETKKEAIVNGILELIERDAAMKVWLNGLNAPTVNLSTVRSLKLKRLLCDISKEGLIAKVILSSQALPVPSFIGIVYPRKNISPFAVIGLSAGVNIEKTIQKCLEEALMVRCSLEYMKKTYGESVFQKDQSQVKTFFDHSLYYSLPEKKADWEFMIKGSSITVEQAKKRFPLPRLQRNTYRFLINILKSFGYDTYAVNLTSDISKTMGFYCSKVIIPKLRQMEIDHNFKFLKYGKKPDKDRLVKSKPHPFA